MKRFAGRGFSWSLGFLLVVAAGGYAAWQRARPAPEGFHSQGFWDGFKSQRGHARIRSSGEREQVGRKACALKAKLETEFPALKVEPQPVDDEQNGFLLLQRLRSSDCQIGEWEISEDFRKLLGGFMNDDFEWSSETAARLLAEHAELVAHVERIASLTTRSSSCLPREDASHVKSSNGRDAACILLIKARLAAESGNEPEALRLVDATSNLAAHYREVEAPSLLGETTGIFIDQYVNRASFEMLLPALGSKADLAGWQAALGDGNFSAARLANLFQGEWNQFADSMLLPLSLDAQRDGELPDAEATARAVTRWFNDAVCRLPAVSLDVVGSCLGEPVEVNGLSSEGKEVAQGSVWGSRSWANGYCHAATRRAIYQAACDLLTLEQGGGSLTAKDAERVTHDPFTGAAFGFDPASRSLTMPAGVESLTKPVILPW